MCDKTPFSAHWRSPAGGEGGFYGGQAVAALLTVCLYIWYNNNVVNLQSSRDGLVFLWQNHRKRCIVKKLDKAIVTGILVFCALSYVANEHNKHERPGVVFYPETASESTNNAVVEVYNASSNSVEVTINGVPKSIGRASSTAWNYVGSFDIVFPTGAGYNVTQSFSSGRSYRFKLTESEAVPGTVEISGCPD